MLSFAAYAVFVAYLCTRVRASGWLATGALIGGVASIAIKLGSAAPAFAAYVLRDDISPDSARLLVDLNAAAFVVDWLPSGLFVACAAAAALRTHDVGRILGWGGVVVGVVNIASSAITGVHVLTGNPAFLLCLLWILLVSLRWGGQRTATTTDRFVTVGIGAGV